MRLDWFSKNPVCKRPCRYLVFIYLVSFAVQLHVHVHVHVVQKCRLVFNLKLWKISIRKNAFSSLNEKLWCKGCTRM